MQEEDILQRSTDHVTERDYPDTFTWNNTQLKLFYNFEPGSNDDGVTLQVPLPLLTSLPKEQMEWLVPGLLEEKCTCILRGLPKQQRKHYVPVPNFVTAFTQAAEFGVGNLYQAFALHLLRMTGIRIEASELAAVEVPEHLHMNLRIVDEKGHLLDESRSWEGLNEKYAAEVGENLTQSEELSWGRQGLTAWDFEELEGDCRITQYAGMEVDAYPALIDRGDSVDLSLRTSESEARFLSVRGTTRLALLNMKEQIRFARKQLQGNELNQVLLLGREFFSKEKLEEQIVWISCRELLGVDQQLIRTREGFDQAIVKSKSGLVESCAKVLTILKESTQLYHDIQKQLKGKVQLTDVTVLNDVKQQLLDLFYKDCLTDLNLDKLQDYPRYLKAVKLRLEKFRRNLRQETLLSDQLQKYRQQYLARLEMNTKQGIYDTELENYRWLLEEYRVSLFAQQLGTRVTVSEKRLKQFWDKFLT
jgi:ATP-dependent helicase HrpA